MLETLELEEIRNTRTPGYKIRIMANFDRSGSIMGTAGVRIKEIRKLSKCFINIEDPEHDSTLREITISRGKDSKHAHSEIQNAVWLMNVAINAFCDPSGSACYFGTNASFKDIIVSGAYGLPPSLCNLSEFQEINSLIQQRIAKMNSIQKTHDDLLRSKEQQGNNLINNFNNQYQATNTGGPQQQNQQHNYFETASNITFEQQNYCNSQNFDNNLCSQFQNSLLISPIQQQDAATNFDQTQATANANANFSNLNIMITPDNHNNNNNNSSNSSGYNNLSDSAPIFITPLGVGDSHYQNQNHGNFESFSYNLGRGPCENVGMVSPTWGCFYYWY